MRVAVAGGTGVVGRHVVTALESAGHDAVVLTRSRGVDVEAGTGLGAALEGVAAVVDASNVLTLSRNRSVKFFTTATGHLHAAEERAGVAHHVALSIVGVDRVDFGYYEGKRRQEELVLGAAVPGTVLRATQFHEFAEQSLARTHGPVAVVPRMRSQPVAAREVGAELARLAVGPALGLTPELAGPEVLEMTDMVRQVVRRRGWRRVVVPLRVPGRAGREMARGGLLPTGPGPRGRETFAEWLAST